MGEDLGSMLERGFGVSDIAKSKKSGGIFKSYKLYLTTLISIKHFPLRRLTCWFNKGEVN